MDSTNIDSSVRHSFKVDGKLEGSGGLHVRLTFSTTVSDLRAPSYVCISGLTNEELLCLCKGGDNVENNSAECFLLANKKATNTVMPIVNKKLEHYNNGVFLHFI